MGAEEREVMEKKGVGRERQSGMKIERNPLNIKGGRKKESLTWSKVTAFRIRNPRLEGQTVRERRQR